MFGKKYNLLHLPFFSFFSKRLYREVGQNWKGANFAYLFLLLAICLLLPALTMRDNLLQALESSQAGFINQIPDIHIKNGHVMVDQNQPLYIRSENGTPLAIVDTTGSMNYIDDANVLALLTESKLIVRRGGNQFNTLNLAQVADFRFNSQIAAGWIQNTKQSLAPLSYGIFLLLSYIFTVLVMLLIAIVGLILSSIIHASLNFSGILRLAAAAATPSIILICVSVALGYAISGVACAVVTMIYLLIGILSCRQPAEEQDMPKLSLSALLHEDEQRSRAA